MRYLPVIDHLRDVLAIPDGWQWDDATTQPTAEQLAGRRAYAWPDRPGGSRDSAESQRLEEANGRWEEAALRVNVAVIEASRGETRATAPSRDTSEVLDEAQHQLTLSVDAHRKDPMWWDLYIESWQLDLVSTHKVRGFLLRLVVRLNDPQPDMEGS